MRTVPTIFAFCWGWPEDGSDCKLRANGQVCYACARHFNLDPR